MRRLLTVFFAVLLAGCPTPPKEGTPAGGGPGAGGPGGPGRPGGGGPGGGGPGALGAPGAAPAGGGTPGTGPGSPGVVGSPGGDVVMRLDVPVQTTQDDISDAVVVSGSVQGECAGALVLDVVPPPIGPPPEPGSQPPDGGDELFGPLTRAQLVGAGPFTMKVPRGASGALSAICDADGDGAVGRGDMVSEAVEFKDISTALDGVELRLAPAELPEGPPAVGAGVGGGTPAAGSPAAATAPPQTGEGAPGPAPGELAPPLGEAPSPGEAMPPEGGSTPVEAPTPG